jgi:hypothetical protein
VNAAQFKLWKRLNRNNSNTPQLKMLRIHNGIMPSAIRAFPAFFSELALRAALSLQQQRLGANF